MRDPRNSQSFRTLLILVTGAFSLPLVVAGCDSSSAPPAITTVTAKGKVTLKDGSPLTEGYVVLTPAKGGEGTWEATGKINPDGTFTLSSAGHEGAVPGEYKVRIDMDSPTGGTVGKKKAVKYPFDKKYTEELTSGLVVKVEQAGGDIPISLK